MTHRNGFRGTSERGLGSEASRVLEQANGTEHDKVQEANDCEVEEGGHGGERTRSVAGPGAVTAPDGGWGWVVLVATIIVLALTLAFPSCVGIFYTDLQNEFHATNSQTSWVPSIMTSVLHAGGRVSTPRHIHPIHTLLQHNFHSQQQDYSERCNISAPFKTPEPPCYSSSFLLLLFRENLKLKRENLGRFSSDLLRLC